jgi:pyridinium-3,5-bisthiocarboxylic acid mononucleotide nickel chelatase
LRLAYFDCFSGISGDMALAALVHAGADLTVISDLLGTLPVERFLVEQEEAEVRGIAGVRIHIRTASHDVIRTYGSIRALLDTSDIPEEPLHVAQRIFRLLAQAVATVQGKEMDLVTFHEWGDIDCLVEVVGSAVALDMLGVDRVFASPIPTGLGMARTEHGMMPIPSPVVTELLKGAPTYSRGVPAELVSPTGAALLAAVCEGYGDMPVLRTDRVGYGAGHLRLDFPNVLRVVVGVEEPVAATSTGQPGLADARDLLVEASLDDLPLDACERLMADLEEAGATDTWITQGIGRKGQPRMTLSAVAPASRRAKLVSVLRAESRVGEIRLLPVQLG